MHLSSADCDPLQGVIQTMTLCKVFSDCDPLKGVCGLFLFSRRCHKVVDLTEKRRWGMGSRMRSGLGQLSHADVSLLLLTFNR